MVAVKWHVNTCKDFLNVACDLGKYDLQYGSLQQ